jgi:hypothetical protein
MIQVVVLLLSFFYPMGGLQISKIVIIIFGNFKPYIPSLEIRKGWFGLKSCLPWCHTQYGYFILVFGKNQFPIHWANFVVGSHANLFFDPCYDS